MFFETGLLLIIVAGIINASFVIPIRYVKQLPIDQIWFYHSLIGLLLLPWLILLFAFPAQLHNYLIVPTPLLLFLFMGGIIFGLGQLSFAYAIEHIGIALSFTINLGLGALLGSVFVIFYHHETFTLLSLFTIIAVILIITSLTHFYYAGEKTQHSAKKLQNTASYQKGWLLGLCAGVASGIQNMVFITVLDKTSAYVEIKQAFWIWPGFLTIAAITMAIGFSYKVRSQKNKQLSWNGLFKTPQNILLILLMGLFFVGSLVFYSAGISELSSARQIIAWPAFMIVIIFTSQMWGMIYQEFNLKKNTSLYYRTIGLILLVIAIIVLSIKT